MRTWISRGGLAFLVWALVGCGGAGAPGQAQTPTDGANIAHNQIDADYLQRPPQDEIIYFVIPDRFENGDP